MDELQKLISLKRRAHERVTQRQEELRAAQEELRAIEITERLMKEQGNFGDELPIQPKLYKSMKQDDSVQDVLEKSHQPMTARQIATALQRGGFPFSTKNPKDTVYQALKANRKGLFSRKEEGQDLKFGLVKWEQAEANQLDIK